MQAQVFGETPDGPYVSVDPQFRDAVPREPLHLIDAAQINTVGPRTVSHEIILGSDRFQIETHGLHGCTVMAILSDRAVYMGHYWESEAFPEDDDFVNLRDQDPKTVKLRAMVDHNFLNPVIGARPVTPGTQGKQAKFRYYNQPGDRTRLVFMTPVIDLVGMEAGTRDNIRYLKTIQYITDELTRPGLGRLPANTPVWIYGYKGLNYDEDENTGALNGPDANRVNTDERGLTLYQYDGQRYRLFLELTMFQSSDQW